MSIYADSNSYSDVSLSVWDKSAQKAQIEPGASPSVRPQRFGYLNLSQLMAICVYLMWRYFLLSAYKINSILVVHTA